MSGVLDSELSFIGTFIFFQYLSEIPVSVSEESTCV